MKKIRKKTGNKKTSKIKNEQRIDPLIKEKGLPDNHRYDEEIADKMSSLMIKAQFARIEHNIPPESLIRKELSEIVKQKSMSRVAVMYFDAILSNCHKMPFSNFAIPLFEQTYAEYFIYKKHMENFKNASMSERLSNLLKLCESNSWCVSYNHNTKCQPPNKNLSFCVHEDHEAKFDQSGNMHTPFRITINTKNLAAFTEMAFSQGIQLFNDSGKGPVYEMILFPDNNIPAVPLTPLSVA